MPKKTSLDPVIVAQLGNLHLRARRILDGLYAGHYTNPLRGQSQEFSEHRLYNPGDDLKSLDWKVFGRTDRLMVKQFEEETNMSAVMILDDSASMNFSWEGRPSKLEYGKMMAAALGYLLVNQHDTIGLVTRERFLRARGHQSHLDQYVKLLQAVQAKGSWEIASLTRSLGISLKKRSFVLVISDLLGNPDDVISSLRALHARKHEVLVFQIFDPAERNLPFEGTMLFEDMETGERLKTDPHVIRSAYKKEVEDRLSAYAHVFRSSGMDYHFLTTDTSFDKGLGAYLSWRGSFL